MTVSQKVAVKGQAAFLVEKPDKSIASLKEALFHRSPSPCVTLILVFRMNPKTHRGLQELIQEDSTNYARITELIARSGRERCEDFREVWRGIAKNDQAEGSFEALPYVHMGIVQMDQEGLSELISGRGLELLSHVGVNANIGIPPMNGIAPQPFARAALRPRTPWWLRHSHLDDVFANGHFGKGEVVGVLDSGVFGNHPELQGKVREFAHFDSRGVAIAKSPIDDAGCHGTKMCGLITGGSTSSPLGSAPDAELVVARVLDGPLRNEQGTLGQIHAGANWILGKKSGGLRISIVNLSLEVLSSSAPYLALTNTMQLLEFAGVQPVVAVGNCGPGSRSLLAGHGLSVGAHNELGQVCNVSGDLPDLVAPGDDIECTQPPIPQLNGQSRDTYGGTSLSTALVSGTLAVLRAASGKPIEDCVGALLQAAQRASGNHNRDARMGWGKVDAKMALDILQQASGPVKRP